MSINLFSISPNDPEAIGQVIDQIMANCDGDQMTHFLADFTHWHRLQGHRASQRERDAARVELEQWQRFLDGLTVDAMEEQV